MPIPIDKIKNLQELVSNVAINLGHASKKYPAGHPNLSAALSAYSQAHMLLELALISDTLQNPRMVTPT